MTTESIRTPQGTPSDVTDLVDGAVDLAHRWIAATARTETARERAAGEQLAALVGDDDGLDLAVRFVDEVVRRLAGNNPQNGDQGPDVELLSVVVVTTSPSVKSSPHAPTSNASPQLAARRNEVGTPTSWLMPAESRGWRLTVDNTMTSRSSSAVTLVWPGSGRAAR